jgi:hypothetical protein
MPNAAVRAAAEGLPAVTRRAVLAGNPQLSAPAASIPQPAAGDDGGRAISLVEDKIMNMHVSRRSLVAATAIAATSVTMPDVEAAASSALAELIADFEFRRAESEALDSEHEDTFAQFLAGDPFPFVLHGQRRLLGPDGTIYHEPWVFHEIWQIERHFSHAVNFGFSDEMRATARENLCRLTAELQKLKDERHARAAAFGVNAACDAAEKASDAMYAALDLIFGHVPRDDRERREKSAFLLNQLDGPYEFDRDVLRAIFGAL